METSGIYLIMAFPETIVQESIELSEPLDSKYPLLQVNLTGVNVVRAVTACTATGESCAQMTAQGINISKENSVVEVKTLPEQPCAKGCLYCSKNPAKSASVQV